MPNTPNLNLPYPLASAPADVPSDMGALATAIDSLAGGGAFSKAPTRQVLTSGVTYTTPAGCRAILVECIGGGGAGGGTFGTATCVGGGGSGGGYSASLISSPVASYAYAIGAAGVQGASGPNNGGNGGDTSFGTGPLVLARGGLGGLGNGASTSQAGQDGAAVGTGTIALVGPDSPGAILGAAPTFGGTGAAGAGPYGGGQRRGGAAANPGSQNGSNGKPFGGGGSGGTCNGSGGTTVGGNGAAGVIIVTEFY